VTIFLRGPCLTGASDAGGVGKNRDSRRISAWLSDWWQLECDRECRRSTVQFTAQFQFRGGYACCALHCRLSCYVCN